MTFLHIFYFGEHLCIVISHFLATVCPNTNVAPEVGGWRGLEARKRDYMIHDKESLQEKFILPQSGMRGEVDETIK